MGSTRRKNPLDHSIIFRLRISPRAFTLRRNMSVAANPLLSKTPTGFPLWSSITPADVKPAMQHLLADMDTRLTELEKTVEPTWDGLVVPYERLGDDLERAWGQISHLKSVK